MIPQHARELLTDAGYDAQFIQMIAYYDTYLKAWEAVERQYFSYFGKNRYTSYESFRAARSRKRNLKTV